MWLLTNKSKQEKIKERLLDLKTVKIGGIKFVIKKINPLIDMPSDQVPQIFSDYNSSRVGASVTEKDIQRIDESIKPILKAGIYKPDLIPPDPDNKFKEKGLTINDLFIDKQIAYKLFEEILNHSLDYFKGISGVFFSIKIKLWQFIQWLKNTQLRLLMLSYRKEITQNSKP